MSRPAQAPSLLEHWSSSMMAWARSGLKGQVRNQQPSFCLWTQRHHSGCWELCLPPSDWGLTWLPGVGQLLQPPAFSLQLASSEQKQPNKSFRRLAMKMPPQQVELYRAHLQGKGSTALESAFVSVQASSEACLDKHLGNLTGKLLATLSCKCNNCTTRGT